jgi:hypothetical protein
MKTIVGVLIAATLAVGSGCAKTDWIERTLVTVDVTGTWSGRSAGTSANREFFLELSKRDQGSRGLCESHRADLLWAPGRALSMAPWLATCSASEWRQAMSKLK